VVIRAGRVFASHSHVAQALYKYADIFPMCVELRWERKNDLCLHISSFFYKTIYCKPLYFSIKTRFNRKFNDPSKNFNDQGRIQDLSENIFFNLKESKRVKIND